MMNTAINLLSVIPMRREPSHRSEMVSQLLFGEYVEVLEEEKDFVKVKCLYDGYEGWIQANQLVYTDKILQTENYIVTWCNEIWINGCKKNIPMCSPVFTTTAELINIGKNEIRYALNPVSVWNSGDNMINKASLEKIYALFLDTPYLWGGKSVFGIDCSGFVQQVFKMFGIKLLRDAYLQAEQGTPVESLDQICLGDLAFFHNENGRIIHVGIILDDHQIVHASGKVRIDTLDENGIVNNETGKRTHQLHSMRRFF